MAPTASIILCLVVSWGCTVQAQNAQYQLDAVDQELGRLTSRVYQLKRDLDSRVAGGKRSEETGQDLGLVLGREIGNGCDDDQFRCGASYQCLSMISVCDGFKDCANGADEELCDSLFSEGDVFMGSCSVNTCNNKLMNDYSYADSWIFKGITRIPWFPQGEMIQWKYIPSDTGTVGYGYGYSSGNSYNWKGMRKFQSLYQTEGSSILDTCSVFQNGRVLKCWGYRPNSYEIDEPCYTCQYYRQV